MRTEQDSHIRAEKMGITTGGLQGVRIFFIPSPQSIDSPYFAVQVIATREEKMEFAAQSQETILHVFSNIKVPDEFKSQ